VADLHADPWLFYMPITTQVNTAWARPARLAAARSPTSFLWAHSRPSAGPSDTGLVLHGNNELKTPNNLVELRRKLVYKEKLMAGFNPHIAGWFSRAH